MQRFHTRKAVFGLPACLARAGAASVATRSATFATLLLAATSTTLHAQTVDTQNGSYLESSPAGLFGQTFTVPPGATHLNGFTFYFSANAALGAPPTLFRAMLFRFDGVHPVGPLLYLTSAGPTAVSVSPNPFTTSLGFLDAGLAVAVGEQYVAFLESLSGSGTLKVSFPELGGTFTDTYAGGAFYQTGPACLGLDPTSCDGAVLPYDANFRANFSNTPTAVPEPTTFVLLVGAMCAMAMVGMQRRRSRVA